MTDGEQAALPGSLGEKKRIRITLQRAGDTPVLYANKVIANYFERDFVLTFYNAVPEPWVGGPENIEDTAVAHVLGRYAINPADWVEMVESFMRQIDQLREAGRMPRSHEPGEG